MTNKKNDENKQTVILVHGLWLGKWVMKKLAVNLQKNGYEVMVLGYSSTKQSPAENAAALYELASQVQTPIVHFVAHSLGGIVVLKFLRQYTWTRPGRVVLLGSPLLGSEKAKRLYRLPLGKKMLGRSVDNGLLSALHASPESREIGMIAGTSPLGLGLILGRLHEPNDGTVAVSETGLPGISETRLIKTSHTGMLFNLQVANEVTAFLRHGHFSG